MNTQAANSTSDKLSRIIAILEGLAVDLDGLRYIAKNYLFREDWRVLLNLYRHANGVSNPIRLRFAESGTTAEQARSIGEVDQALSALLDTLTALRLEETLDAPCLVGDSPKLGTLGGFESRSTPITRQ